jgi:predicted O-methyltransferase YrrM
VSNQSIELSQHLYHYLLANSLREAPVLERLRADTAKLDMANMQIAPEQGQFMALLARLIKARVYVEVGTFTGYSALVMALAMGEDAHVYALDISEEWTAIGKRYWREAGANERIHLLLRNADESLQELERTHSGTVDIMFIDADKPGYPAYIEHAHILLRQGGLLMIDNTLWGGSVADPADNEPDTVAIRAVNKAMLKDERFDMSMVPIGDGLTLAVKR